MSNADDTKADYNIDVCVVYWYQDVMSILCAWNRVAALVSLFLFCAFANFPLCTFCCNSGESRFRL